MQDFKKIQVWHKSHHLVLAAYKATASFPKGELFGLTTQLRRSCASIPANIAEGCGRGGGAERGRFLRVAMGSASEVEYHLLLAHELGFVGNADFKVLEAQKVEVKRMFASFIQKLKARPFRPASDG